MGMFSAEREVAADTRSEPAGSSRNGASRSAGRRDSSAAVLGANSSFMQGVSCKATMPQPDTSRKAACRMPGELLDRNRMGCHIPDIGGATASTAMTNASAQIHAAQKPPTESAAGDLIRQDRSARHREGTQQPDMNDMDQMAAMAVEPLARVKAAQGEGQKAAPDQGLEQSGPELAAQEPKPARKQAKRARQRARRAQGAAAGADSKVFFSRLCVTAPCRAKLRAASHMSCGFIPGGQQAVLDDVYDNTVLT